MGIRGSDKDMPNDFSFMENVHIPKVEKKKTYRQLLQELRPSSSTPNLSFGHGNSPRPQSSGPVLGPSVVGAAAARAAFSLRPSSSFVNLGRSRTAIVRVK